MRTLAAVVGLAVMLASVPSAEAGWWIFKRDKDPNKKYLPQSLDYPRIRPKMQETHKQGKRAGDHPEHRVQQTN